uniref:Type III-B CRISPR module RAMP protein Cmr6 n=1 Tax=Desulfobacca acetoxidans TaxID=60893 RepID=A0A7V6A490_9BACT
MTAIPQISAKSWEQAVRDRCLHPGLAFYRFLEDQKGQFQEGLKLLTNSVSLPFVAELVERQQKQLRFLEDNGWVTSCFQAELISRLAIGLGIPNRAENGFWLDQTHGLPLIPGSVLKGVSQDYALLSRGEWPGAEALRNDPELIALFGAQTPEVRDKHFQARQGHVVFFEALPVSASQENPFDLDIINPHYQPYYSEGKPPADYYSPVPIVFLTVKKGVKYQFALAARDADFTWKNSQGVECSCQMAATDLLTLAAGYLEGAITQLGVGGKTSLGYGLFRMPSEKK